MSSEQGNFERILPLLPVRTFAYDWLRRTFLAGHRQDYLKSGGEEGLSEEFSFAGKSELIHKSVENVSKYLKNRDSGVRLSSINGTGIIPVCL